MLQSLILAAALALGAWGVVFAAVAPLMPSAGIAGLFFDRVLKVENFGLGKTALITPGLGATYDKFILLLGGGLVAAKITEIRIMANDIEVFKDTATYLNNRQAYKGISTDAAEVCIDFTDPRAKGGAAQQYLASLPANLLKKLQIEVDIDPTANAGSTLAVAAEFRGPTQNPFILKRRRFQANLATGDNDLFLPAGVSGGLIKRVWLHDAGHIQSARLQVGGFIAMWYRTMAELTRLQARQLPALVPQANIQVLDFIADGNLSGVLDTTAPKGQQAPDVKLALNLDAPYNVVGFIDYIDPIDRLK